jgi:ankyrin repeat protein
MVAVTTLDRMGRDELHYAALENKVELLKERLAAGVPVDLTEKRNGWTPLHFAAQDGSVAAAEALLAAGADVDAKSKRGQTPLWVAVMNSNSSPNGAMVMLLLRNGADRNLRADTGQTPLELAQRISEFPMEWFDEVPEKQP